MSRPQSPPVAVIVAVVAAVAGVALIVAGVTMLWGATSSDSAAPTTAGAGVSTTVGAVTTTAAGTATTTTVALPPIQFVPLGDDGGLISVEVPSTWEDRRVGAWNRDGVEVGLSVNAAVDIDAWVEGWDTPGLFVGVTDTLGLAGAFGDFSASCQVDRGEPLLVAGFPGTGQWWWDCGEPGTSFFEAVVQLPEGAIALFQVLETPDRLPEVVARVLESFVYGG